MKNGGLNFLIGGPAGAGIEKSGSILALAFVRAGYFAFSNIEHASQIRGGNNFLRLRIGEAPHEVHSEEIDVMIALDKQTIDEHVSEVVDDGAIIYDSEMIKPAPDFDSKKIKMIGVPLKKIATEDLGNSLAENMIALGILFELVGFDIASVRNVLEKIWGKKGAEIVNLNMKALEEGGRIVKERGCEKFGIGLRGKEKKGRGIGGKKTTKNMFLCGNDALCIGAIKAGCKFVGEYPMTPSSSILHFMAAWAEKYGIVVKHTEDEIAAVNSVIGAGFAGVRGIAATSGGGFALMTEGIGLASMNEVPIVVVDVMRPGPATGLPTRTGQGDLRQVIHAGQDDPVKIVLLPGSPKECFEMGLSAFNLAEKYQLPVIICYDKYLGEGYYTVSPFDMDGLKIERGKVLNEDMLAKISDYKRYSFAKDGVSPRSLPGMKGGIHRATSDEHNEYGEICEDALNREKMVEKRMKKLEIALKELPGPELVGDKDADVTFVTWSSTVGACMEACERGGRGGRGAREDVRKRGKRHTRVGGMCACLQIKTAWPFHKKETTEILKSLKRPVLVEQNYTAQLGGLIAEQTGIVIKEKILKYDGSPMTAKYILENLKNLKT